MESQAAEQGNAQAQYNLGAMYSEGQGVVQSDAKAVGWYLKAAEQEFAPAQYVMGFVHSRGQGVAKSYTEALQWFTKAAEKGVSEAQGCLGVLLACGEEGVEVNLTESFKYLTLAAVGSSAQAGKTAKEALQHFFPNGAPVSLPQPPAAACSQCGVAAPGLKACPRCKVVTYCSKGYQVAHWKEGHKKTTVAPQAPSILPLVLLAYNDLLFVVTQRERKRGWEVGRRQYQGAQGELGHGTPPCLRRSSHRQLKT